MRLPNLAAGVVRTNTCGTDAAVANRRGVVPSGGGGEINCAMFECETVANCPQGCTKCNAGACAK